MIELEEAVADLSTADFINFSEFFGSPGKTLPGAVREKISTGYFTYQVPDATEQNSLLFQVNSYIEHEVKGRSVSQEEASTSRQQLWNRCYAESDTVPSFLIKPEGQPVRLSGRYVIPESGLFEADFLAVVRAYLFDKYFASLHEVAEFGCGTGHNLLALAKQQPGKVVYGLDWSSSALVHVRRLREQGVNAHAVMFDLLDPRRDLYLNLKSVGVLTVGALEQIGKRFDDFLCFLLSRCPPICVHLEPVVELYDEVSPFDQLAIRYHRARGYLEGFLPAVQRLARYGLAQILEVRRIPFGSFYHEAYTYIVWRPTRG